jgi:hypothetical protein
MLRHAWLLLLCLLASSLVATSTVHAQENYLAEMPCSEMAHLEGDANEAPADGSQPFPHHHGACHGHNVTVSVASLALPPMLIARDTPKASGTSRLARRMVGPALEPPRA